MRKFLFVPLLFGFLFPYVAFSQTTWTAHDYTVSFKIKNAGISVNGKFTGLKCNIMFSPEKLPASKITASVDAGTLTTGINKRDKDVKDEKYLNADTFKLIEATSVKLYTKDNDYAGLFKITIKGVTKEIEIPFQFIQLGDEAEFNAEFTLNRRDFNVGGGSMTMSDDVKVHVLIKAKK